MATTTVICGQCGQVLHEDAGLTVKPPCPHCGSSKRETRVKLEAAVETSAALGLMRVREYVKRSPFWTVVLAVLVIGSAIASWLLSEWLVLVIAAGLLFALLRYLVGTRAAVRVIERDTFGA